MATRALTEDRSHRTTKRVAPKHRLNLQLVGLSDVIQMILFR
jgi:hypothetical protein